MPYHVRILSTALACPSLTAIRKAVIDLDKHIALDCEDGIDADWRQLLLRHDDGSDIAVIERDVVAEGSLGQEELKEFAEEIEAYRPRSAVAWLMAYFENVRCIYAFQILRGADQKHGRELFHRVMSAVQQLAPGIVQADSEGFSNEAGYHILWQFDDNVEGPWQMGVLSEGRWVHFEMELSDRAQRRAFCEGRVPNGVKILPPETGANAS